MKEKKIINLGEIESFSEINKIKAGSTTLINISCALKEDGRYCHTLKSFLIVCSLKAIKTCENMILTSLFIN